MFIAIDLWLWTERARLSAPASDRRRAQTSPEPATKPPEPATKPPERGGAPSAVPDP